MIIRTLDEVAELPKGTHILCLYSGGLDSSYLLWRLVKDGRYKLTALCVGLGQDTTGAEAIARELGVHIIVENRVGEFVHDYVRPAILCQATYLGTHPVSASLSRPLIASTAVDVATILGCEAILHTSTPSQNSLRRYNDAIRLCGYTGCWGSPFEQSLLSREEKFTALRGLRIGIQQLNGRSCSEDTNIWCHELEFGALDDPENIDMSKAPFHWLKTAKDHFQLQEVSLQIARGLPISLNGEQLSLKDLVTRLNVEAGAYGIGCYVSLEELSSGQKVQEVREAPAASVIFSALRRLEAGCLASELIRVKQYIEQLWVREAGEGRWFAPMRRACEQFLEEAARDVCGNVTLMFKAGQCEVTGMKAEKPLYVRNRVELEQLSS